MRARVGAVGNAQPVKRALDQRRVSAPILELLCQREIGAQAQGRNQPQGLEHDPEMAATDDIAGLCPVGGGKHLLPEAHAPLVGPLQSAQAVEQGRLARTRRPDQQRTLSGCKGEGDPGENPPASEGLAEIVRCQLHRQCRCPRRSRSQWAAMSSAAPATVRACSPASFSRNSAPIRAAKALATKRAAQQTRPASQQRRAAYQQHRRDQRGMEPFVFAQRLRQGDQRHCRQARQQPRQG